LSSVTLLPMDPFGFFFHFQAKRKGKMITDL